MNTLIVKTRKDGAISIPAAIRRRYGISPKTPFEVSIDENGLHYVPHHLDCPICGSRMSHDTTVNVPFLGVCICQQCNVGLKRAFTTYKAPSLQAALISVHTGKNPVKKHSRISRK